MTAIENKPLSIPLRLAVAAVLVGALFHIQRWPFAGIILFGGLGLVALLYSIRFILKSEKQLNDYLKLIFIFSWIATTIVTILHFPYKLPLQIIAIATSLFLYFNDGFARPKNLQGEERVEKTFLILIRTALALILTGMFCFAMGWPIGIILFMAGLAIGMVCLFLDGFI